MRDMVEQIGEWTNKVFAGHQEKVTPKVRALRLLEEVIELCQAEDISVEEINIIRDQVMNKQSGLPFLEFRGVMVTLMGYAFTKRYDPKHAFWLEFGRINQPEMIEKIRNRNLSGDKIGMK